MPRTLEEIAQALASLRREYFEFYRSEAAGLERLYELTDELMTLPRPERVARALFDVMERLPESDLGSPGPLVHTLEKMRDHYQPELVESIRRRPSPLAVWMVNRILNTSLPPRERDFYLDLLREAAENPVAPEAARKNALEFISYQRQRAL